MRSIRVNRDWRDAEYINSSDVGTHSDSHDALIAANSYAVSSTGRIGLQAGMHKISTDAVLSTGGTYAGTDRTLAPSRSPVIIPRSRPVQALLKRAFDIAGAGFGLLLLAPLLLTLAIIIRSGSKGPIFFRQTRTGQNNRPFQILKFRSMYTDRCDITGVAQTIKDDPRVTPIGRVMRRTNLDELPQLINVLRGEMSLVGPRPHVPGMLAAGELYEDLVPGYERRHLMRPGITGLAQVNGLRGPTTERKPSVERVICDLTYVRDFSLWLDVKILVKTLLSELRGGTGC